MVSTNHDLYSYRSGGSVGWEGRYLSVWGDTRRVCRVKESREGEVATGRELAPTTVDQVMRQMDKKRV